MSLSTTLSTMNFEPSREDPEIWLMMSTNLKGENYQEQIVVYVNNLHGISEDPKAVIDSFSIYDLKDTVISPDKYLGDNVGKWKCSDGSNCWWVNGRYYISNTISLDKNLM